MEQGRRFCHVSGYIIIGVLIESLCLLILQLTLLKKHLEFFFSSINSFESSIFNRSLSWVENQRKVNKLYFLLINALDFSKWSLFNLFRLDDKISLYYIVSQGIWKCQWTILSSFFLNEHRRRQNYLSNGYNRGTTAKLTCPKIKMEWINYQKLLKYSS